MCYTPSSPFPVPPEREVMGMDVQTIGEALNANNDKYSK